MRQQQLILKSDLIARSDGGHHRPSPAATLTIMALAWRACDYLLGAMKKGEIAAPV